MRPNEVTKSAIDERTDPANASALSYTCARLMRRTVLIVDDSATIREIVKIYLAGKDIEFLEAQDGERALSVCRLTPITLVIADIKMPGMDGIEFTHQVRISGKPELEKVPIVLLTGEKDADLRTRGLAAGATAFLHKPISGQALREVTDPYLTAAP
jgi:CheY-like chemotaxis protein